MKLTKILFSFFLVFFLSFSSITIIGAESTESPANNDVNLDDEEKLVRLFEIPNNPYVAQLTIFSVASSSQSSSSNYSGHSWVTIKNINTNNTKIRVGKVTGIERNKTVSVGTFGNKLNNSGKTKKGIFYNLESYFQSKNSSSYRGRVSLTMSLTQNQLNTVNNFITNNDKWSLTNNCANFAVKLWNGVSSTKLSSGTPATPKKLVNSIKSKSGYKTNASMPFHYPVRYANGKSNTTLSKKYK
ncbi:hypothetical protein [Amphibacillus sediminis]|uniref:hypothetical protein n=1 Tax=Amphibacillus sediminis TaxID=360185 RepID=UPI000833CCA7|nr:hypothetical protein [Amphibacillus sediminis]